MRGAMPVYHIMNKKDIFDMVFLSIMVDMLTNLINRNQGDAYRLPRLENMKEVLLTRIEPSYKGSIPPEIENLITKYMGWIEKDLTIMLDTLKNTK